MAGQRQYSQGKKGKGGKNAEVTVKGGEGEKKVEHPSAEKTKEELEKEAEDKQKKSQSEFVKGFSTLDGGEVPSYNDDEEMWTEEKGRNERACELCNERSEEQRAKRAC